VNKPCRKGAGKHQKKRSLQQGTRKGSSLGRTVALAFAHCVPTTGCCARCVLGGLAVVDGEESPVVT
jgi:hypothetical protein